MTSKPVHILLVEDDEIDAEAIQRAFKRKRIANPIVVEPDGVEALSRLRGTDGKVALPRPYLILLDLNLPRMSGLHFLEILREDPDLKSSITFVLTTSNLEDDREAAYDRQVAGYILKERAGEDFLELLEMLHHYWRVVEFPSL